jgi:pyruvate dehydrogenase E1 component alpha subunit
MHVVDLEHGILPTAAIVGAGIPMATGAALAIRKRRGGQVVVCFFGDGASNIGFFHESLNFAAIQKLPVVFLAENNQYAISMPQSRSMAVPRISDRASAYGLPGVTVDGNDVLAVYQAACEAVQKAREGSGPTLLECVTYRLMGHSHGDQGRGIKYRSQEEMDAWAARDPIPCFEKHLIAEGILTKADIEAMERLVDEEITEAIQYAKDSPLPAPDELLGHVFAQESTS